MVGIRSIKTTKRITTDDLRNLCIEKDYYTCGDCEAYDELFDYVRDRDLTDSDIIAIADNIYDHSDIDRIAMEYGSSKDGVFNSIYFEVGRLVNWFCESNCY